ncbi:MAG: DUF859 family phage minor structural protein [Oscillospiraceae bacterium]|jgi:microcystin-dependent protein|nr:DUF859 family phage minor structural protein [Oscillospiraceae bacterium]
MGTSAEMSTSNQYVKYNISVTQNSQNISENYSNVTVSVYFYRTNSGYKTYGTGNVWCKINGTQYSASISSSQKITNSGITLFSKTLDVTHNSDGSKTLICSAWISIDTPLSSSEQSYSQTLSTIPRSATFSDATNFNDTENPKIYFNNPGGFKLCLKMEAGGDVELIMRDNIYPSSPCTFSLTTAERNSLLQLASNSNTLSVRFTVGTYLTGTAGDWSYGDRTMTVTNAYSGFTSSQLSYQDTNSSIVAITGDNQQIVRNQSNLQISFTSATSKKYATISSYQITFNGSTTTKTSSGSISYGTVNSGSNLSVSIKAIDSKGNSTTAIKTITFLDWITPTATIIANRKNNFEAETYLKVSVLISSVNGKNSLQILQYRNKKSYDSSYGSWTDLPNNTQITISIDSTVAWNFQIQLSDKFGSNSYSFTIAKGQPIMFFDTDKISVGVNTFPDRNNFFQALNIESIGVLRTSSTNTGSNYIYGNTYFSNPSGSTTTTSISNNLSLSTAAKQYISQFIYPVGSIFMSISSTNPSSYFGGSWSLWGSGRVPVCVNTSDSDFSSSEKTGGAKTVTLTTSQIPSHTHGLARAPAGSGYKESCGYTTTATREQTTYSDSTGGGSSHSNLQPYITCYMLLYSCFN